MFSFDLKRPPGTFLQPAGRRLIVPEGLFVCNVPRFMEASEGVSWSSADRRRMAAVPFHSQHLLQHDKIIRSVFFTEPMSEKKCNRRIVSRDIVIQALDPVPFGAIAQQIKPGRTITFSPVFCHDNDIGNIHLPAFVQMIGCFAHKQLLFIQNVSIKSFFLRIRHPAGIPILPPASGEVNGSSPFLLYAMVSSSPIHFSRNHRSSNPGTTSLIILYAPLCSRPIHTQRCRTKPRILAIDRRCFQMDKKRFARLTPLI